MKKELELRLVEGLETLASISTVLEYDETNEYDEGVLYFQHPITGEMFENVRDILVGWSEMDEREEKNIEELVELVIEDQDLLQKAWDMEEIEYFTETKDKMTEIENEILGCELSFLNLDNIMVSFGYYSVFDDGITEDIKKDGNIYYTSVESGEIEIQIFFNITIDNGEDEDEDAFRLEVTSIERF